MSASHFAVQARPFTSTSTRSTSVRSNARSVGAKRFPGSQRQSHVCNVVDRRETAEQAKARRVRESEAISERVVTVTDIAELDAQIEKAGDKLMVIEVYSEAHCMIDEEHEIAPGSCQGIKTSFQRTARDCPDALFLEVEVADGNSELAESLGIEVLPTVQFVKNGKLLWEHRGVSNLDQDLAEGVLFYGDAGAGGSHPSDFITEIQNKADLEKWYANLDDKVLGVLDVSMSNAAACVHIYPTVVVLARQFTGFASFARLIGDSSDEAKALVKELNVKTVPTFRFYRNATVVGEHIGTSRSDLISAILGKQGELGLTPPPPEEGRKARMQHAAEDAKKGPKRVEKKWNSIF